MPGIIRWTRASAPAPSRRRGTFYLNTTVDDLKKLIKGAKDGKVSRKFGPSTLSQLGSALASTRCPEPAHAFDSLTERSSTKP